MTQPWFKNHPTLLYTTSYIGEVPLKGTVQRDFRPLVFFIISTSLSPLTNGLKYFRIWFRFRQDIRILIAKN